MTGIAYPNGQTAVFAYYGPVAPAGTGNGDRRLAGITHVLPGGGGTLSQFDYTYAPAGDIATWTQTQGGPARFHDFRYDQAGQLTGADVTVSGTKTGQFGYRYDKAGNRVQ